MEKRNKEKGLRAAEKKRMAKRQREESPLSIRDEEEGKNQSIDDDLTKNMSNEKQPTEVSHTMTLDSVRTELNPTTPS
eukprot:scaffold8073_cov127-Amphora_coffeaeformis.AAC.1